MCVVKAIPFVGLMHHIDGPLARTTSVPKKVVILLGRVNLFKPTEKKACLLYWLHSFFAQLLFFLKNQESKYRGYLKIVSHFYYKLPSGLRLSVFVNVWANMIISCGYTFHEVLCTIAGHIIYVHFSFPFQHTALHRVADICENEIWEQKA